MSRDSHMTIYLGVIVDDYVTHYTLRNSWQTRRERKTSTTNGSPLQRERGERVRNFSICH